MEDEYDLDLGGNLTLGGVDLELVETRIVNKPRDIHFLWINIPLLLLTPYHCPFIVSSQATTVTF